MEKSTLDAIVKKIGGFSDDNDIDAFLEKINYLEATQRYGELIKRILPANDVGDFLGSVFETNIAYQFESNQLKLEYGVKQNKSHGSDIDLLMRMDSGHLVYFEAKLLQQDISTSQRINEQLNKSSFYSVCMDGDTINGSIFRLQSTIISKIQKVDGTPIKFFSSDHEVVNIVVINVSELMLDTIGIFDCLIAAYGSRDVQEVLGAGYANWVQGNEIVGLFQVMPSKCSNDENNIYAVYERARSILHGILFLFKTPDSGVLSYDLESYITWNPSVMNQELIKDILATINKAFPIRPDRARQC
jgi:hypothetical protein